MEENTQVQEVKQEQVEVVVNEKPNTKFCKYCGAVIDMDVVVCPKCGKQVELLKSDEPKVIVNNANTNTNTNLNINPRSGKWCDKWLAFVLCLFLGVFGVHKFYEGRVGLGILYIFTLGLFGIGWLVDIIIILTKPDPYFVER